MSATDQVSLYDGLHTTLITLCTTSKGRGKPSPYPTRSTTRPV